MLVSIAAIEVPSNSTNRQADLFIAVAIKYLLSDKIVFGKIPTTWAVAEQAISVGDRVKYEWWDKNASLTTEYARWPIDNNSRSIAKIPLGIKFF